MKGGKREGAGRKPRPGYLPLNLAPKGVRLDADLIARVDAARGSQSFSEVAREALEAWLKDRPTSP